MITVNPVGYVKNNIDKPVDDNWGDIVSQIELTDEFPSVALTGLIEFSHVEILYHFNKVEDSKICLDARHPRNNETWPKVGIFSQRGKNRPNKIGVTICRIIGVDGKTLKVKGLDAINGTPVLDIKPVFREYLPENVNEPEWVTELMKYYW